MEEQKIPQTGREAVGRSAVVSARREASLAGLEMLQKGGSAADAAVAAAFALSVCEPYGSGLGGGGMAVTGRRGRWSFWDFREQAPAALLPETAETPGRAVAVPGAPAGLLALQETLGTLSRETVLAPAIRLAEEGWTVTPYCAKVLAEARPMAERFPALQTFLWQGGAPAAVGTWLRNPRQGAALRRIAQQGAAGFYTGPTAGAIAAAICCAGGRLSVGDLERYRVRQSVALMGSYRGFPLVTAGFGSGGPAVVELLHLMEQFDLAALALNGAEALHLWAEAGRVVFADRRRYHADPAFAAPPETLLGETYAALRAAQIDPCRAGETPAPAATIPGHTTHLTAVDDDGGVVTVTLTLGDYFGSGVAAEGFCLNATARDFSADPRSANGPAPGKRPLSAMSPTVVLGADGAPYLALGSPGGDRIIATVAQTVSRMVDHGLSLPEAIAAPRCWNPAAENGLEAEWPPPAPSRYPITVEALEYLRAMGHALCVPVVSGAVHAVAFREDGTLLAAADPRQDGAAAAFQ